MVLAGREALAAWRRAQSGPVHFVPTMGNLHAGHLALVERAREDAAAVLASIFINPEQFGPGEDFAAYPRTPGDDLDALGRVGCDAVWMPDEQTMYPLAPRERFAIRAPEALAATLCGAHRPGHFDGVCNVVMRLFWQARPDAAWFGEKDWQQLRILAGLATDFSVPVRIEAAPTVREDDGLALSSRNRYLTADQRRVAPVLYRALVETARSAAAAEPGTFATLERSAMERLATAGFEPEYVAIRDGGSLGPATGQQDRVFGAARLGTARLIDNVAVKRHSCL